MGIEPKLGIQPLNKHIKHDDTHSRIPRYYINTPNKGSPFFINPILNPWGMDQSTRMESSGFSSYDLTNPNS